MRDEFDSGDGSHLNALAYAMLDREFLSFLETLTQYRRPGVFNRAVTR